MPVASLTRQNAQTTTTTFSASLSARRLLARIITRPSLTIGGMRIGHPSS
jgi:hypothetical protein